MFDQLMKRSNWVCVYKMGRFAEERRAFLCDLNKQDHSLRTLRNALYRNMTEEGRQGWKLVLNICSGPGTNR